jgi:hypothetical protein
MKMNKIIFHNKVRRAHFLLECDAYAIDHSSLLFLCDTEADSDLEDKWALTFHWQAEQF